mgnify:CR=1 FL=1
MVCATSIPSQDVITIIIVTYESAGVIERCLSGLRGAAPRRGVEILVVDNASSDGSAEIAARLLGAEHAHPSYLVTALSLAAMAAGWGLAWLAADGLPSWEPTWRALHPGFQEAVESDWGWQPFCHSLARGVGHGALFLGEVVEGALWDPGTEDLASAVPAAGELIGRRARGLFNDYAWWMTAGAAALALTVTLCL